MKAIKGTGASRSVTRDPVSIVAETLRSKIANGDIGPGERIYEAQLARELGIGRSHVREAARRLERERLLVTKPNFGFLVREMTIGDFISLIDVRIAVERHAIRSVVRRKDVHTVIDELLGIVEEIQRAVDNDSIEAEAVADMKFHRAIVAAAGNDLLLDIYDELAVEMRISMRIISTAGQNWKKLPEQHRAIAHALKSPRGVEQMIEEHIASNWDSAIEDMKRRNRIPLSLVARAPDGG